ncbi:MAG: lamin tail domain-containing protein [Candidatus Thorarchaeota archaeon]
MRWKMLIAALIICFLIIGVVAIYIYVINRPPLDTTAPTVIITSPSDGDTLSGTVTISFTATDVASINGTEIYIDDDIRATTTTYVWNTTMETNGNHSILCRASDSFGNWGQARVTILVNNSPPPPTQPIENETQTTYSDAFKVMSYNIEESGANANWKNVVMEENPDILVLIETGTFDDNGNETLDEIISEFNTYFSNELPYVGYCAQGISYSTDGETVLSRFPVIEFKQIPIVKLDNGSDYDVTHDFVDAIVNVNGTDMHVIGAHLKARDGSSNEWRRERETEGIINYMDSLGSVPILYMGDLNSFSPDDTGSLAPLGDLGYGPMTMMLYPNDPVYGQYASTVHNFTDVFRALNPTDPGYTYGHQDSYYLSRIDFLVANQFFSGRLINSTVGDTPSADTGSDHYCVDVFIRANLTTHQDHEPPAKVTGLTVSDVSFSEVDLTWAPNSESDISHYRVYRDGILLAQVYGTTYNDTGLNESTSYVYEVSAVDTSLNEGPRSNPLNISTTNKGDPDLVVINEFLPDPDSLYSDEWIELYNPQDVDVNISGYFLDDIAINGSNPYLIPKGTVIPAHGYIVFYKSTTGINLNTENDTVNLIRPDGVTIIDSHEYNSTMNDISIGRATDGEATWTTFSFPTPGASNTDESAPADAVVINEFLPSPNTLYTEEWIELYNPLNESVDISRYILDDIVAGGSSPYTIPFGTTIPANGFALFNYSTTGIALNNAGDNVTLLRPNYKEIIDSYSYNSSTNDVSIGRATDGNATWTTFVSPTPGASNVHSSSAADSIYINEFLPDPNTLYSEEWIELYNPLNESVDLSGYVLDDITGGGSSPYTIPSGTIVPALGFIVFNQSTTGIALNNAGDTVNFLRPDGSTVVDSHSYNSSTDDVSIGRETDGGDNWTTFISPTPGASNVVSSTNADAVIINEFLPDPDTAYSEEWIELYNPLNETVDISGYILDDITSGGSSPYTIPQGTIISAYGFALFNQSTTGIALNNAGDTVNFLSPNGTVLDSFTYNSSSNDVSYGRSIDGGSTWKTFASPTPGASNGGGLLISNNKNKMAIAVDIAQEILQQTKQHSHERRTDHHEEWLTNGCSNKIR